MINAILNDSRLVFSLASFGRQAISRRGNWLGEVCVRGRLCTPPEHWHCNLFQHLPSAAEFPPNFEQSFTECKPWLFDLHAYGFSYAGASVHRSPPFRILCLSFMSFFALALFLFPSVRLCHRRVAHPLLQSAFFSHIQSATSSRAVWLCVFYPTAIFPP